MNGTKFLFSSPQLFSLLFFYLLSGMMLYSGGSFFSALFTALFSACLCVIVCAIAYGRGSSLALFLSAFGPAGSALRIAAAFFSSIPLMSTVSAFSADVAAAYGGEKAPPFAVAAAFFCFLGVCGGFARAARFSEICFFALVGAFLLSLFGGGDGIDLSFSEGVLFSGFDAVGAPAVFLTLYARCIMPKSKKMTDFARNSTFHPSPLSAGLFACFSSLALYSYFCFTGSNILFSLLSWFPVLARILLLAISIADLLAYPEGKKGTKCAFIACAFCAFHILSGSFLKEFFSKAQILTAIILPFIIFIASTLADKKTPSHEL